MKLFVGLGNPGAQYALNRHNVGFMAIDAIAATHDFTSWRKRFQGWTAEAKLGGEQVILLKPATFMNESGQSAQEAVRFYKLELDDVIVFHDELDLDRKLGGEQVILLKPATFMNESGQSAQEAVRFYKLELDDVIVFHDELD